MKTRHLAILLLTLVLILCTAPMVRADGPSDLSNHADAAEPLPFDLGDEPIEPRDGPVGALGEPSVSPVVQSSDNWHFETVDSDGWVGKSSSLALDGAGRPHISYFDSSNYDLKYAWYDGGNWRIETVDSEGNVGQYTSLAMDTADRPHISYYDSVNYDLKYAWYDGANWQIETVDSEGSVGIYTSLALDGTGQPHISYYDTTNNDLKYAWSDGANWHIETVDNGDVGGHTSLALDEAGYPHISYCDSYPNYDLKYAWYDGGSWQIETVDSERGAGLYTSLVLDRANRPHISYSQRGFCVMRPCLFYLKYAWHNEVSWQIKTVDHSGINASLALDGAERPHISYVGWHNYNLQYARHNGISWQIEILDNEGNVGSNTSLVLDEADRPHISYYVAFPNFDLKYARPQFFLSKRDSTDGSLHTNDTFTYTLTFASSGSNVRLWDPLPRAVHYVSGSLTSIVTPAAVYSPTARAVVWQGTLPTGTTQVVRFQVTPHVTGTGLVPVPITNTAWLTDTDSGWVVSSTAGVDVLPPPFYLGKRATPTDGLRNDGTLTYTLAVSGCGLTLRLWDPLSPLVRYVSGSITDTFGTLALSAAIYSPTAHAVVWQGTLPTDTLHMVQFQATRGITGPGSLDLSLPIANTAWLTDTDSGWSISAMAIVNGKHIYLPLVVK